MLVFNLECLKKALKIIQKLNCSLCLSGWGCFTYLCVTTQQQPLFLQDAHEIMAHCGLKRKQSLRVKLLK